MTKMVWSQGGHIKRRLLHFYSGAKFNVISLYLTNINLTLASGDQLSAFYICLKWVETALFQRFSEVKLFFFTRKATQNVELMSG